MKVSVVIVNYRTCDLLRTCLETLAKQKQSHEVIVADNASDDGSVEMLAKEFPKVKVIANDRNVGFAAANNQGFTAANGDLLMMLNADTELPETTVLGDLAKALTADPRIGVLGPRLLNAAGQVQPSAAWTDPTLLTLGLEYTLLNRLLYRVFGDQRYVGKLLLSPGELAEPQDVGDLLGAALIFRRSLLDEIGRLDEQFFVFLEETDFNRRARRARYILRYDPRIELIHHWGGSVDSAGNLRRRFELYYPSLYAFLRKHHGRLYAGLAYGEAVVGSLVAAALVGVGLLVATLLRPIRPGIRRSVLGQWPIVSGILRWHLGSRS
jgi:GT2 family glycosyltransferase